MSPPQSPDDGFDQRFPAAESWGDAGPASPPPAGASSTSIDTAALLRGEPAESVPKPSPSVVTPTTLNSGSGRADGQAPRNPFARTLANIEPGGKEVSRDSSRTEGESGSGKAALDVDAFKRLLLTGKVGELSKDESNSSTDVSLTSRQSGHTHEESSGSSIEEPDVQSRTVPRTGPQTISFSDFESSFPSLSVEDSSSGLKRPPSRPTLARSTSDLNKPLPRPPATGLPAGATVVNREKTEAAQSDPSGPSVPSTVHNDMAKKSQPSPSPPPPPTSRRQGNASSRPRSTSNLSNVSSSTETSEHHNTGPTRNSRPAPLPPARRTSGLMTRTTQEAPSDNSTPASDTGPRSQMLEAGDGGSTLDGASSKMRPPPPPPSRGSKPPPPLARTPSVQSTSSISNRRTSPSLGAAPPPPPPPRRSENKRLSREGSFSTDRRPSSESRRSSTEYRRSLVLSGDVQRRDSSASLQRVAEDLSPSATIPGEPADSAVERDILADLSALQKEVDALRAKAGR